MSLPEKTGTVVRQEVFKYTEGCEEATTSLMGTLLKKSDREDLLDYLKELASRQKANAWSFLLKDRVSFFKNLSDYYGTRSKIVAVKKELRNLEMAIQELNDDVASYYISSRNRSNIFDPVEGEVIFEYEETEEDVFADTDEPVDLSEEGEEPEGEASTEDNAPIEGNEAAEDAASAEEEAPAEDAAPTEDKKPVTGDTITAQRVEGEIDDAS